MVGTGSRIRVWHDRRCGDLPLKEAFFVLYECASNHDAIIDSVLVAGMIVCSINGMLLLFVILTIGRCSWPCLFSISFIPTSL